MKLLAPFAVGTLGIALGGCLFGGPVPADKLARSEAAVRGAEEIGAERNAIGSRHLQTARESFKEGKRLVMEGEQDRATMMLLRAEADAQLAMNVTREATALEDARKTRDEVRTIRMSLTKGGN